MTSTEGEDNHYLTFTLGEERYAICVAKVEVVLESAAITRVPKAPPFMRGLINYRGSVIPVADLRARFSIPFDRTEAPIIVLSLEYEGDDVIMGLIADSVTEVIELGPGSIERPPSMGSGEDDGHLAGIASDGEGFVLVLDIDKLFQARDRIPLAEKAKGAAT